MSTIVVEVAITVVVVLFVAHIIYRKVIKKSSGGCFCNKDGKSEKKCSK
ncbi:hypothetical protein B0I63_003334 [Clostridium beijerinckii]|nr:hypothetical protein [Clostridium beijerinckii]NRT41052.1 hypothetical protein [Clostridium beijerinckii]NRU10612.1 hypothetical protein [Clostridium beijerinckii]NRU76628.1 hypothetical protein [Clostridium beijerinckii]NRU80029.1 hypothetical protein [Clostridium beijerinckii]NRV90718.1 hypothetical protein [Clostridium beijerinckii]